jgi:hypothetical protein
MMIVLWKLMRCAIVNPASCVPATGEIEGTGQFLTTASI